MLERAVGLDPDYAPAWTALGQRYLYESQYGRTGRRPRNSFSAPRPRRSAPSPLDPNLSEAEVGLILLQAERGDN